jgi:hypothetical protein
MSSIGTPEIGCWESVRIAANNTATWTATQAKALANGIAVGAAKVYAVSKEFFSEFAKYSQIAWIGAKGFVANYRGELMVGLSAAALTALAARLFGWFNKPATAAAATPAQTARA